MPLGQVLEVCRALSSPPSLFASFGVRACRKAQLFTECSALGAASQTPDVPTRLPFHSPAAAVTLYLLDVEATETCTVQPVQQEIERQSQNFLASLPLQDTLRQQSPQGRDLSPFMPIQSSWSLCSNNAKAEA